MENIQKHWSYTVDENNIAWLCFDKQGSSVNTLDTEVLVELEAALDELNRQTVEAVIFTSGKDNGFIYGADINQFKDSDDLAKVDELISLGQKVFRQIEDLRHRTIALINGFCLGGGLELALACNYRVACLDKAETMLGLPEVKLGILPAWGGTVRLPRLISIFPAMDIMLTGRMIKAKEAQKIGLVDAAVPTRVLNNAVKDFALKEKSPRKSRLSYHFTEFKITRDIIGAILESKLSRKIKRSDYPAPFEVLKHWRRYGSKSNIGYRREIDAINKLLISDTAHNLVNLFFLREDIKTKAKQHQIQAGHIHIIGAGIMGADIAIYCAYKGFKVTVQDINHDMLGKLFAKAYSFARKKLKEEHLVAAMVDKIIPDLNGDYLQHADIIIEAVAENLDLKREIFHKIEKAAKEDALIATNTSTIPIEEIAIALRNPSRLLGIHFFNPVEKMPLVEVIRSEHTDNVNIEKAFAFCSKIDKLPLEVKSSPGFLVNRILLPYMLEAVSLYDEGVSAITIDKAAKLFGMPMGPLELADTVGLDICLHALEKLSQDIDLEIPKVLRDKVSHKELGKKTNKGFYTYSNGHISYSFLDTSSKFIPIDVIDRLKFRLINESLSCLEEKIVANEGEVDVGSVFGFGFAPFKGGIISYLKQSDPAKMYDRLLSLKDKYGEKFKPANHWQNYL